jgi:uncharacterized protein (DUF1501 family)
MSQSIMRGIAWDETLPLTLAGGDRALPVADINDFKLIGATQTQPARMELLQRAYLRTDNPLEAAALNTLNTVTALQDINFSNYLPSGGANYPQNNGFARGLMMTAAMMKANVGLEAFHLDLGGWDTHANEGTNGGFLANHLQGFAQSLAAFYADITAGNGIPFTLVVLSEFGRTAIENGSRGTDHGHGNALFVLGQGIKGGRVLAKWPGLKASQLYQGQDLDVTIDHRDILAEIVQKRLGNSALSFVFPGFTPTVQNIAL